MTKPRFHRSRVFTAALLTLLATTLAIPYIPATGAPPNKMKYRLKWPKRVSKPVAYHSPPVVPNTLLIMPNKGDTDDALQKLREVNGTIVRTVGRGELLTWVVEFENQEKFLKAEKELVKDKHFKKMQRNYAFQPKALNDSFYGSQYYINDLNVEGAWAQSLGSASGPGGTIGIIDTGVNPKNVDLVGKLLSGYDCNKDTEYQKDTAGHGTLVSTSAAAIGDNFKLTAGPARLSKIFPLMAYSKKLGYFPEDNLLEAIDQAGQRGLKIINMSLNADPPFTLANPVYNSVMQAYFQDFHDNKGGLVFNSCGNSATFDASARLPYLIVVSATDESGSLSWFSTWGNCVWFTAPGTNIACSSKKGKIAFVNGTSFSCPLTAAVAALIWGAKPSLTNTQVEQALITTAVQPFDAPPGTNIFYGYGMPDASAAMDAVLP